jgi:hypothetical protein
MSRKELEAACRSVGYIPEVDDTDSDLWMVLSEAGYFRKAA